MKAPVFRQLAGCNECNEIEIVMLRSANYEKSLIAGDGKGKSQPQFEFGFRLSA